MGPDPFRAGNLPALLRWPIERALGLPALRRLYQDVCCFGPHRSAEPFASRVLRALHIDVDVPPADLSRIPSSGPVVVTANHPHGAVDGLVLLELVRRVRPDVRVLANRVLQRIPELDDACFFVDPFAGPEAGARSRAGLRAAHLWLRRGGALVIFPAGEVGHTWDQGSLVDTQWKRTFERLAERTGARIVPAHIDGRNSRLFYAAGRVHPRLRTALLGRELLNKQGRTIAVRIGAQDEVAAEVGRLNPGTCLVENGAFQVFCVEAAAIPATVREIGRLRELAFRAIGEGTGRTIDLDRFDDSYLHLFAWDREQRRVAGAYRIGRTDRIVAKDGVAGLYTRTLFRYDERLIARLGAPALELGRSFVRPEYQKNYGALLLLWRGIGQFVARHPEYRLLFGPVSISARYSDTSHALLMAFLQQNHRDADRAELVEALNPPPGRSAGAAAVVPHDLDEVNRLVAGVERDGKGLPVLLRQYLKLNARLLGFNVDPAFGDALDALMVVDLTTVDSTILQRYLGRGGAASFLAVHSRTTASRAA